MGGIQINVSKVVGGEFTLELKPNGDAKAILGSEKGNGDWEETDKGFKLKDSSGGKVKTDYSGMTILFEKGSASR